MTSSPTQSLRSIEKIQVLPPSPPLSPASEESSAKRQGSPQASTSSRFSLPTIEPLDDEIHSSISSHLNRSHRRRLNPFHSSSHISKTIILDETTPDIDPVGALETTNSLAKPQKSTNLPSVQVPQTRNPEALGLDEIDEPEWTPPPLTSRPTNSSSIKLSVAVRRAGTVLRHGHPDGSNRRQLKAEKKWANRPNGAVELDDVGGEGERDSDSDRYESGRLGRIASSLRNSSSRRGRPREGSQRTQTFDTLPETTQLEPGEGSRPPTLSLAPSSPVSSFQSPLERPTSHEPLLANSIPSNRPLSPLPQTPSSNDEPSSSTVEIPLASKLPSTANTPTCRPSTPHRQQDDGQQREAAATNPRDPAGMTVEQFDPLEEQIDLALVKSMSTLNDRPGSMNGSGDASVEGSVVWERLWENQRGKLDDFSCFLHLTSDLSDHVGSSHQIDMLGILFFGTPRYSSSSLFPSDPSPYSRPGKTKIACRTAYTPDSFQVNLDTELGLDRVSTAD